MAGGKDEACKMLNTFMRKTKLSPAHRIIIAKLYRSMHNIEAALKILGKLESPARLIELPEEEVKLQVFLVFLLGVYGIKHLSARYHQKMKEYHDQSGNFPLEPTFFYNASVIFLSLDNLCMSKKCADDFLHKIEGKPEFTLFLHELMGMMTCYEQDYEKGGFHYDELLRVSADKGWLSWQAVALNRRAEVALRCQDYEQALKFVNRCLAIQKAKPELSPQERIITQILLGEIHFAQKNLAKATEHFVEAIHQGMAQMCWLNLVFCALYYLEKINPKNITLSQQVAIRCHPDSSEFAYLSGKRWVDGKSLPMSPWARTQYVPTPFDSWIISCSIDAAVSIEACDYRLWVRAKNISPSLTEKVSILDLVSGIIFSAKGPIHLSELNHKGLFAIIGSGQLGILKLALTDFIYQQDFYDVDAGVERTTKIVLSLRKMGFAISLANNYYTINLEPLCKKFSQIILPMSWHMAGKWRYAIEAAPNFSTRTLETLYRLPPSTAKKWLHKWKKQGFLKQVM